MKGIAALLSAAYLLVASVLGGSGREAEKIGPLMEHFRWHRSRSATPLSFFDFFVMHYCDRSHRAADPEHHAQLPYNGPRTTAPPVVMAAPQPNTAVLGGRTTEAPRSTTASEGEPEFLRGHPGRIFHPPKSRRAAA